MIECKDSNGALIDCTPVLCEIERCLYYLQLSSVHNYPTTDGTNQSESVCGTNGELFTTLRDFCTKVVTTSEIDHSNDGTTTDTGFYTCNGNTCTTETECCKENCIVNEPVVAGGVCWNTLLTNSYPTYDSADTWCDF